MVVDQEHGTGRRKFLKSVGSISVLSLFSRRKSLAATPANRELRGFVTSDTQKHQELSAESFARVKSSQVAQGADNIFVDRSQRFQPMLGFGCAYTDASCFLLNSMPPQLRRTFLVETFSPQRMSLNVGRTSIGASDYSRDVYSYNDTADDLTMQHFSIAHDEAYILPMLREMRQINPDLFLLSTPWSPPGWMKTYGSMLGGWMTEKYLAPYALYLARFLETYRTAGVPINAITSQNELETDQGGSMPATYWTPELESDFVRDHLGPMLKQRNDKTQIWLLDHNYNLWKRVRWQMADSELRKYVSGVAWHGYVGTPDQMSRLHEVFPELPFYWTEGGPDITDPKYALDWTRWGTVFTAAINNWCRSLITWNLMLDEHGAPNLGPFSCGGLVTLRNSTDLQYSGQYWALRHFSQHIRRDAVRIASHSDSSELSHVAFENTDGSFALVLTNTGDDRDVHLSTDSLQAKVRLVRNSLTTLTW